MSHNDVFPNVWALLVEFYPRLHIGRQVSISFRHKFARLENKISKNSVRHKKYTF